MLSDYVLKHVIHSAYTCGKCFDAPDHPEKKQLNNHSVDLTFFKIYANGAVKEEFLSLVKKEHPEWLDGKEHNYLKVGAELGDQIIGLMCIGLGHLLEVWKALSPDNGMIALKA